VTGTVADHVANVGTAVVLLDRMAGVGRQLEFVGLLGKGGFGSVYLANLRGPAGCRRRVAVKVMNEGLDAHPDLLARQRDEARLLGLLSHDAIVQVLDLTVVGARPAVVLEYVHGADLAALSRALPDRRLPLKAALEAIATAADALDAAANTRDPDTGRALHVIHRDIKPANLFVTTGGRLKVLDFGIARADFDREGHTGSVSFGTPRFMAPEQWLAEPYDASVDVYALGVTLFELLAGRPWERPALAPDAFAAQVHRGLAELAGRDTEAACDLVRQMTTWYAGERPRPAEVALVAGRLVDDVRGEGLAALARRVLPPLLDAREAAMAAPVTGLPGPITLAGTSIAPERPTDLTVGDAPSVPLAATGAASAAPAMPATPGRLGPGARPRGPSTGLLVLAAGGGFAAVAGLAVLGSFAAWYGLFAPEAASPDTDTPLVDAPLAEPPLAADDPPAPDAPPPTPASKASARSWRNWPGSRR
jgi:serine/threonine-protein kinase